NALILLVVAVALIWLPVRRSRLGLLIYAVGSDRIAAFRSGVGIDSTRILAYIVGGLFSALGGLALTMTTGIGAPLAGTYYTLSSVAAIVIGGVRPTGGRGGSGAARNRQCDLAVERAAVRRAARDTRGGADAGHVDRRHRPFGGRHRHRRRLYPRHQRLSRQRRRRRAR